MKLIATPAKLHYSLVLLRRSFIATPVKLHCSLDGAPTALTKLHCSLDKASTTPAKLDCNSVNSVRAQLQLSWSSNTATATPPEPPQQRPLPHDRAPSQRRDGTTTAATPPEPPSCSQTKRRRRTPTTAELPQVAVRFPPHPITMQALPWRRAWPPGPEAGHCGRQRMLIF